MEAEQVPGRRRRLALLAYGVCVVAIAAVLAGVYGSKQVGANKRRAGPEEIESKHYDDPYLGLIKANQPVVSPTPAGVSTIPPPLAPKPVPVSSNEGDSITDDDDAERDYDQPSAWQKILSGVLGGDKAAADSKSNSTTTKKDGDGKAATEKKLPGGAATGGYCYPQTGKDLIKYVTDNSYLCTTIIVGRNHEHPYYVKEEMNVTSTKILIGLNPIDPPLIDAYKAKRAFNVLRGGRLDLRGLHIMRGSAHRYTTDPENYLRLIGGIAAIYPGAFFSATGVTFREPIQTYPSFSRDLERAGTLAYRIYGGHLLVLGGDVFLNGCNFIGAKQYGNPLINQVVVGKDILVVSGNVVALGVHHVAYSLFGLNLVVGTVICVFAGTYTYAGGSITGAVEAYVLLVAGVITFTGAGVFLMFGVTYSNVVGLGARMQYGQTAVGAGLHLSIGYLYSAAWGLTARAWAGGQSAVGSGIMRTIGGATAFVTLAEAGYGAGGTYFVGTGSLNTQMYGRFYARIVLHNAGVGFNSWLGSGLFQNHHDPYFAVDVTRAQYGVATDVGQGTGWMNYINNSRTTYGVARVFFGVGTTVYLGSGGAVFIRVNYKSVRAVDYANTKAIITVGNQSLVKYDLKKNWVFRDGHFVSTKKYNFSKPIGDDGGGGGGGGGERRVLARKASLRRTQGVFGPPPSKIVAVGVSNERYRLDMSKVDLKKLSNKPILDMRRMAQAMQGVFEEGLVADKEPWTIKSEGAQSVFGCSLTPGKSADHYEGDTEADLSDACKGQTTAELLASAKKVSKEPLDLPPLGLHMRAPDPSDEDDVAKPSTTVVQWYRATAYCGKDELECVSASIVRAAIRRYLSEPRNLEMTVAPAGLNKIGRMLSTPEVVSATLPEDRADCPVHSDFNVYMAWNEQDNITTISSQMDALVGDASELHGLLGEEMEEWGLNSQLCGLSWRKVMRNRYPPMEEMPAFKPTALGQIGPSVTVSALDSIAPPTELAAGQTFKVYVQNFPKGSEVEVRLVKSLGDGTNAPLLTVKNFDASKYAEALAEAPLQTGKYFLYARQKDMPIRYAFSTPFEVVKRLTFPGRRW